MLDLPCFFPSVSSVKTCLEPVDYVELLSASGHALCLISAYDLAHADQERQVRLDRALKKATEQGTVVLLDSGNYEAFWKDDGTWTAESFHGVARQVDHALCFCFDNQEPPDTVEEITEDIVSRVLKDQVNSRGSVVPIVHGRPDLLPEATRAAAQQLCPVMVGVPERALGAGILKRMRTVREIRNALDSLGVYYPIHLLGTGDPISIAAYAIAGADSFDGLEWCQSVTDHSTGTLHDLQHWDFFREQTTWGRDDSLPYVQRALMHNLAFYHRFMVELGRHLETDHPLEFLSDALPMDRIDLIQRTATGEGRHDRQ